jgi:hypothetical protein
MKTHAEIIRDIVEGRTRAKGRFSTPFDNDMYTVPGCIKGKSHVPMPRDKKAHYRNSYGQRVEISVSDLRKDIP